MAACYDMFFIPKDQDDFDSDCYSSDNELDNGIGNLCALHEVSALGSVWLHF